MRLILMRHAKTHARHDSGEDHPRELTERGRADAAQTAVALHAAGWAPDCALVSSSARTMATWSILASAFPAANAYESDALYLAGGDTLLNAARASFHDADGETVLVLTHNPGLKEAAYALLGLPGAHNDDARARLSEGLPTGWACLFDGADADLTQASLVAMIGPTRTG